MRITIVRSGGFTGMPVEYSLDEHDLPPAQMDEVDQAFQEAGFFSLPTKLPDHSGGADQYNYTITVEEGGRAHTIVCTESSLPQPLGEMVQKMMRRSRGQDG